MAEPAETPPKWGSTEMLPLPARFNGAVRALAAQRLATTRAKWEDVVFYPQYDLFNLGDALARQQDALEDRGRFAFSAPVSLESEPEKYKQPDRAASAYANGPAADGRRQVGV